MTNSDQNDIFYIGIAEGQDQRDVSQLLRRTAQEVRDRQAQSPIYVSAMYMQRPLHLSEGEGPMMVVHYWSKDKEDVRQETENKNWTKDYKATERKEAIEHILPEENPPFNALIYRLPQGQHQDDVSLLLQEVATYLEQLSGVEVIDVTYSDPVDNDAIRHPELHVFYIRKS